MYYSSINTCQNQVKLCTLKVEDDVQLAIAKFCMSIKDCQSQTDFKDFSKTGFRLHLPFSDTRARPRFSVRTWEAASGENEDWQNP